MAVLEERPGYLLVENLAVDPSRQGEGVGELRLYGWSPPVPTG